MGYQPRNMPAAYEQLRPRGDARNNRQNMAELKLRRLTELNARLREDLERPRVKVTEASMSLINYCNNTRDFMVPSVWGQVEKREDPYAPQQSGGCCIIM
ncbi:Guanine nucleotide-binding protein subunit gamma [Coccidioides posadasii str. Silveira]|nr:Guanine nucleotide-binding protein subunit gamma [Coccidioides posadasii str. Silveira]